MAWINASSALRLTDLTPELVACGLACGVSPWPESQPEQAAATLAHFCAHPNRLVVLDNLDHPALLSELLPRLGTVRLLITTRLQALPQQLNLHTQPLDSFTRPESVAFLQHALPNRHDPQSDLATLAERLYDHPLALHVAACYLTVTPSETIPAYLQRLKDLTTQTPLRQPALPAALDSPSPTGHTPRLDATFQVSWDCLDPSDPLDQTARQLYCAAGYLAANSPILPQVLAAILAERTVSSQFILTRLKVPQVLHSGLRPIAAFLAKFFLAT